MKNRFEPSAAVPIGDVAALVGCSRRFLDKAAKRGDLRCVKIAGRRGRYVSPEDLAEFMKPKPANDRRPK